MTAPASKGAAPTRPLYHEDGTRLTFTATVQAISRQARNGQASNGQEVALDATAFYPQGGGQNGDAGTLRWPGGEARVTDTRKDKAIGVVWHRLEGEAPPPGTAVTGEVDAARRWQNMQRHSGEHLLAQAFFRVNPAFEVAAVSMAGAECTLDLRGDPAEVHVRAAEALLRRVLGRGDLTLETPNVPDTDLHLYPLRRPPQVSGQVRLVIFRDEQGEIFDASACGGTHVPRASMAAPVVVLRAERHRAGLTRVVFMAGEEASEYLSGVYRDARNLAGQFSAPVEDLGTRVDALRAERDALSAQAAGLRRDLAAALIAAAPARDVAGRPTREFTAPDPEVLLALLGGVLSGSVLLGVTPAGRCGVASACPDVNAAQVLRAALERTAGKGGGRADLAQGQTADPEGFLGAAREALAAHLASTAPAGAE